MGGCIFVVANRLTNSTRRACTDISLFNARTVTEQHPDWDLQATTAPAHFGGSNNASSAGADEQTTGNGWQGLKAGGRNKTGRRGEERQASEAKCPGRLKHSNGKPWPIPLHGAPGDDKHHRAPLQVPHRARDIVVTTFVLRELNPGGAV